MTKKQFVMKFEVDVYVTPTTRYPMKRILGLIVSKVFDALTTMLHVDDVYTTFVSKEEMVVPVRCRGFRYQKQQAIKALEEYDV